MKAKEIRDMSADEIQQRIREQQEELTQLRFQHAVATIQNPLELRQRRREIARLRTILKQKASA